MSRVYQYLLKHVALKSNIDNRESHNLSFFRSSRKFRWSDMQSFVYEKLTDHVVEFLCLFNLYIYIYAIYDFTQSQNWRLQWMNIIIMITDMDQYRFHFSERLMELQTGNTTTKQTLKLNTNRTVHTGRTAKQQKKKSVIKHASLT